MFEYIWYTVQRWQRHYSSLVSRDPLEMIQYADLMLKKHFLYF